MRHAMTDFATQLAGPATIVEVEEARGCTAMSTTTGRRHRAGAATPPNRRQRPTMVSVVLSAQLLPVQGRRGRGNGGRLSQGSQRIDVEVAIVGMLLAKVVARLRLGLTPSENLLQLIDELLQFLGGKFPAEPKRQAWYLAHGGDSLGNLVGSWKVDWERESAPPFVLAVKSRRSSTLKAEWGQAALPLTPTSAHRRRGEKAQTPASPRNSTDYRLKEGKFLTIGTY